MSNGKLWQHWLLVLLHVASWSDTKAAQADNASTPLCTTTCTSLPAHACPGRAGSQCEEPLARRAL